MALHQGKMTKQSIEHSVPNSRQHEQDVAQNAELKALKREVLVFKPRDNFATTIDKSPCLNEFKNGWQYVKTDTGLYTAIDEKFIQFQNEIRSNRDYYFSERFDKKLGRKRLIKRKVTPDAVLSQFALTLSPVHGAVLKRIYEHLLAHGEPSAAKEFAFRIIDGIGRAGVREFERITGRIATGLSVHLDTQAPHFHIQNTRINANHELVGDKGQGTSGSQFTIYRDLKLGLVEKGSEKYSDFYRNMKRYEERKKSLPTDILLTKFVDELFPNILKRQFPNQTEMIDSLIAKETEIYRQKRLENEKRAIEEKEQELLADLATIRTEKESRIRLQKTVAPPEINFPKMPLPDIDIPIP